MRRISKVESKVRVIGKPNLEELRRAVEQVAWEIYREQKAS